jgi:flagellar hook-associated protein 2
MRALRDQLASAVSKGVGGKSFADVGIQLDRDGKLVFDEAKFQMAYAADPSGVASKFVDATATAPAGFASTLAGITKSLSDPLQGTVTLSIQGHNAGIKSTQDAISDWDVRLQQRQEDLQRQFSAMEVMLGQLQNQASWLSGQIASLPTMSS